MVSAETEAAAAARLLARCVAGGARVAAGDRLRHRRNAHRCPGDIDPRLLRLGRFGVPRLVLTLWRGVRGLSRWWRRWRRRWRGSRFGLGGAHRSRRGIARRRRGARRRVRLRFLGSGGRTPENEPAATYDSGDERRRKDRGCRFRAVPLLRSVAGFREVEFGPDISGLRRRTRAQGRSRAALRRHRLQPRQRRARPIGRRSPAAVR